MKHVRPEEEEEPDVSWEERTVEDTRNLIVSFMDPLSRHLLMLTSKANYAWLATDRIEYFQYGRRTFMIWMSKCGMRMHELIHAFGTLDLVKRLTIRWGDAAAAVRAAAYYGNVEVLQWLYTHSWYECHVNSLLMSGAARVGQLSTIQWLHSIGMVYPGSFVMHDAIFSGSVVLVEWLLDTYCPSPILYGDSLYDTAITYRHVDIIMCLYKHQAAPWKKSERQGLLQLLTPPRSALMAVFVDEIKDSFM